MQMTTKQHFISLLQAINPANDKDAQIRDHLIKEVTDCHHTAPDLLLSLVEETLYFQSERGCEYNIGQPLTYDDGIQFLTTYNLMP